MTPDELYTQTSKMMKDRQWEAVLNLLDAKTLTKSKSWKLYWNAGWANFKLNKLEDSSKQFIWAKALAKDKKDYAICLTFLGICQLEMKDFDEAVETLLESLKAKDTNLARKTLAMTYLHLNDPENAEKIHLEGIKKEPKSKERLAAYGDFLLDVGRLDEADAIKEKILKMK